jgi:hypothetical protein
MLLTLLWLLDSLLLPRHAGALAVADVRDLCFVFVTAVDPAVARLLLLLASLESCCCFLLCC